MILLTMSLGIMFDFSFDETFISTSPIHYLIEQVKFNLYKKEEEEEGTWGGWGGERERAGGRNRVGEFFLLEVFLSFSLALFLNICSFFPLFRVNE